MRGFLNFLIGWLSLASFSSSLWQVVQVLLMSLRTFAWLAKGAEV